MNLWKDKKQKRFRLSALRKKQLCCFLAASCLALLCSMRDASGDGRVLLREGYGRGTRTYPVYVKGLFGERETELTVEVGARTYTKEEAEDAFWSLSEALPAIILGENDSLDAVSSDLSLIRRDEERGIRLTWYPGNADLISYDGKVANEALKGPVETSLKAVMTDGTHSGSFVYALKVVPKKRTAAEEQLLEFQKRLSEMDELQRTEEQLVLPASFAGRSLTYRRESGKESAYILLLGLAAMILLGLREKNEEAARQKKRREELMLDYSELVSKLIVYLGAGLTIRNAWEKITVRYQEDLKQGCTETRCLYEEMGQSLRDMRRGIPDGQVYREFGRRCGLQPYLKLCTLLEQNRKNGGGNLEPLLRAEMEAAFEERKNTARRRGEEAGTKLLLPLLLMLLVVMVIVTVPAMLSMG